MAELYAIAGSMERARFLLAGEVPYLQLRFKDHPLEPHRGEISRWSSRFPATRLIINDDLEFAESIGAWGVHLGQEDSKRYSRSVLCDTFLNLGISTHSDGEIRHALELSPAMLGFGPIFETGSKEVGHRPQGLARLREVVEAVPRPIVAIGGINDANLKGIVATGVAMVAMIAQIQALTSQEHLKSLRGLMGN